MSEVPGFWNYARFLRAKGVSTANQDELERACAIGTRPHGTGKDHSILAKRAGVPCVFELKLSMGVAGLAVIQVLKFN